MELMTYYVGVLCGAAMGLIFHIADERRRLGVQLALYSLATLLVLVRVVK